MSAPAGGRLRPTGSNHLLSVAALAPAAHAREAFEQWLATADWGDLAPGDMRLLPLIERRFQNDEQLAERNTELLRQLAYFSRFNFIRGRMMLRTVSAGLGAMRDAGIDVMLIKGGAVIPAVGADDHVRAMGDIDAMVRAPDIPRAVSVLIEAGFPRYPETRTFDLETDLRHWVDTHHSLDFGREGETIELHWRPFHKQTGDAALIEEWWSHAVPATVGGVELLASCPEDTLVQTVGHAGSWQPGSSPRWVVDIALLLEHHGETMDWDRVVKMARVTRLASLTVDALEYVIEAGTHTVPPEPMAALKRAPVPLVERLRKSAPRDPTDGGPTPPGRLMRLAETYEDRLAQSEYLGRRTTPRIVARVWAREWGLPRARLVPAQALFLAAGRPWPVRRLLRRALGAPGRPAGEFPVYQLKTGLTFGYAGTGMAYLGDGWEFPDEQAVFTGSMLGHVVLPLSEPVERDLELEIDVHGRTEARIEPIRLEVVVNDVKLKEHVFSDSENRSRRWELTIPRRALRGWNRIELTLVNRHPFTGVEARVDGDDRRRGVALFWLRLE